MYHVVNGSYFSQDLRDGQQLASILNMKPIQVGVRVDGCSRKYCNHLLFASFLPTLGDFQCKWLEQPTSKAKMNERSINRFH